MILMALLPVVAMAQKSSITLNFSGLEAGTRIVVSEAQGGKVVPTDTFDLNAKGIVKVERRGSQPSFFMVALSGERNAQVHCLLLPSEKVSMDVSYLPDSKLMRINAVKGSKNMEAYRQYNNLMVEAVSDESKRATMPQQMEQIVRANSKQLMSAFLVTFFESSFDQYASLYKQVYLDLKNDYSQHEFVQHLEAKVQNVVAVGMEAPDIAMPDTAGHMRSLSSLKGKVVLIDFWASWCGPCRRENPNVVRVYNKYHDKGFEIFSVSLDKDYDKWVEAIRADGLNWPYHVSDLRGWQSEGGRRYGIQSIPATVLLDREGKVIARNLRGEQLEKKLQEIFAE